MLSQARVASVLWHPLGVNGSCLVTVTADVAVRLWELNTGDRWSFDSPGIAVDLKKLHYAQSAEDDLSAEGIGHNKGFSLDGLGMEASAAAFGGRGLDEESGWSAMTIYVAMSEGDVYAMCPLLPSKWSPPELSLPVLSATVSARRAFLQSTEATAESRWVNEEQCRWLSELEQAEPMTVPGKGDRASEVTMYDRPKDVSSIPRLQGPFRILPGDMEDLMDIVDIHVIAPKVDMEELPEEQIPLDFQEGRGLSMPFISLLTSAGTLYTCVSLEEVEAKWLPLKKVWQTLLAVTMS